MKPDAIIVDIDGTMALRGERDPYDMSTVLQDQPNRFVIRTVHALARTGLQVIYCSGRMEVARADTVKWLQLHTSYRWEELIMRRDGDKRPDDMVKYEMYIDEIQPYWDIVGVLDDRDKVVKMWRETGLVCFQVAEGDF